MSKLVIVVLVVIVLLIVGPLLTIWALNTLFPSLAIPITLETWVAAAIVNGLFASRVSVNK